MRLRGCSIGTQPDGFEIIQNTVEDKYYDLLAYDRVLTDKYYDLLAYDRVLTDEELKEYELDYIGVVEMKECFLWTCYGIDWKFRGIK